MTLGVLQTPLCLASDPYVREMILKVVSEAKASVPAGRVAGMLGRRGSLAPEVPGLEGGGSLGQMTQDSF